MSKLCERVKKHGWLCARLALLSMIAACSGVTGSYAGNSCYLTYESPKPAPSGALEMVVFGDSAMWGNGLREEHKSRTLVQQWFSQMMNGKPLHIRVYAHSGATVLPDSTREDYSPRPGAVGGSYPTISEQSDCVAPSEREKVDLILMDGCINDIGAPAILDPSVDPAWIADQAKRKCREPMKNLLTKIVAAYPKAWVIVTGYFPLISGNTPLLSLADLVLVWLRPEKVILASPPQAAAVSQSWYSASNEHLQWAVEQANQADPFKPYAFGRVVFAPIPFGSDNSYGGTNSYLWPIPVQLASIISGYPVLSFSSEDEDYGERAPLCDQYLPLNQGAADHIQCRENAAFHPNVIGAQVWASAARTALESRLREEIAHPHLKFTTTPAMVSACRDENISVQVTHAQDPVSGAVEILGVAAGSTNQPFRYRFALERGGGLDAPEMVLPRVTVKIPNFGNFSTSFQLNPPPHLVIEVTTNPDPIEAGKPTKVLVAAKDAGTGQPVQGQVYLHGNQLGTTGAEFTHQFPRSALGAGRGTGGEVIEKDPFALWWVLSECHAAQRVGPPGDSSVAGSAQPPVPVETEPSAGQSSGQASPPATVSNKGRDPEETSAAQGASGTTKVLFEAMPNLHVVQTETVEFDFYKFGYLPDAPRIEGRRTTTSYGLNPGSPMPGALGICRHFADATRKAGGEVLYDNDRNIITVRVKQGRQETWAEFACDKDRYRVNIIEREGAGQSKSDTAPDQSNPTEMKELNAKVRDAVKANADKAFDELSAEEAKHTRMAAPPAGSGQGAATVSGRYAIVVDKATGGLAPPSPCTDAPTLLRHAWPSKYKGGDFTSAMRRSTADSRARAEISKTLDTYLMLVDENTWSCHSKDGTQVEGALVTDQPLKGEGAAPKSNTSGQFSIVADNGGNAGLAAPVPCTDPPTQMSQLGARRVWSRIPLKRGIIGEIRRSKLNLVDTNMWSCHTKDGRLVEGALVTDGPLK
jgi:lysophospholipase L1-like esterase/ribosomal protein L35AE/L33A